MGQELDRIKADMMRDMVVVKEAGGNIQFCFQYLSYLNDLKTAGDGQAGIFEQGNGKFRRRVVQVAAVAAAKDITALSAATDVDASAVAEFATAAPQGLKAARHAYVNAAGHFLVDALSGAPDPTPPAAERRLKATADWDRLIENEPDSLAMLALFGHERPPRLPLADRIREFGLRLFTSIWVGDR